MKKLILAFLFPFMALGQGTPTLRFNTVADMVARPIPTINNSLTALVTGRVTANDGGGGTFYFTAASVTATNLGTVFPSTGVVGRWFREYSGALDILWFGAISGGSSSTAIQAAIDLAQATGQSVFVPAGTYATSSILTVSTVGNLVLFGESMQSSVIRASAVITNIFKIGSTAAQTEFVKFSDITLDGQGDVQSAIYSARLDHCEFKRIHIIETTGSAMNLGYGWDVDILECEISHNSGNGIRLNYDHDFVHNAFNIINTKIYANTGIGISIGTGHGIRISGCTIEENLKTGIFTEIGVTGLVISGNYYEGNGTAGYTFTTPATTVYADNILNGSTATDYSSATPNKGVSITGNFTTSATNVVFVKLLGATGVTVSGNGCVSNGSNILVSAPARYSVTENVSIFDNDTAFTPLQITDSATGNGGVFSSYSISTVSPQNFLSDNIFDYAYISGPGGTFKRGDLSYNGFSTMAITNVIGESSLFGIQLPLASYPELAGQNVYMGAWFKRSVGATMGAAVSVNGLVSPDLTSAGTNWFWNEMQAVLPATGTINFGFGKVNGVATNVMYIANPILTIVGNRKESFYKVIKDPLWSNSAAPTTGSWQVGDVIWDTVPSQGANSAFVCTVAGEPGTWGVFGFSGIAAGPLFHVKAVDGSTLPAQIELDLGNGNPSEYLRLWNTASGFAKWALRKNGSNNLGIGGYDGTGVFNSDFFTFEYGGNFILNSVGKGIQFKEGSNARMGVSTLVNGTVTVSNTSITANTRIFATRQAINGSTTIGTLEAGTKVVGTSFVINSYTSIAGIAADDDSIVAWLLVEPSP